MRKKKEKGGEGLSGILFENFFLLGLLLAFFVVWLDYFFFFEFVCILEVGIE